MSTIYSCHSDECSGWPDNRVVQLLDHSRVEDSVLSCCCMSGDFDLVDSSATHLPPSLSYVLLTHSRSPAAGGGIELQWAVNCDMRRDQDGKKGESTGFHWLFRIKYTVYPANVCWSWWMCDTNPDWHRSGFSTDICGKHETMESTSSRFFPPAFTVRKGRFILCVVLHFLGLLIRLRPIGNTSR